MTDLCDWTLSSLLIVFTSWHIVLPFGVSVILFPVWWYKERAFSSCSFVGTCLAWVSGRHSVSWGLRVPDPQEGSQEASLWC